MEGRCEESDYLGAWIRELCMQLRLRHLNQISLMPARVWSLQNASLILEQRFLSSLGLREIIGLVVTALLSPITAFRGTARVSDRGLPRIFPCVTTSSSQFSMGTDFTPCSALSHAIFVPKLRQQRYHRHPHQTTNSSLPQTLVLEIQHKLTGVQQAMALPNLKAFFDDKEFSDVVIYVGDQKFHCHRLIICPRSEHFRAICARKGLVVNVRASAILTLEHSR